MSSPRSDRDGIIRRCYQRALTALRQKYDDEFQSMLADEYDKAGLNVRKRKSRIASRKPTEKENHNG